MYMLLLFFSSFQKSARNSTKYPVLCDEVEHTCLHFN